jgi:hypothetical protein
VNPRFRLLVTVMAAASTLVGVAGWRAANAAAEQSTHFAYPSPLVMPAVAPAGDWCLAVADVTLNSTGVGVMVNGFAVQ